MANPRGLNYYKSLNYRIELFFDPEDKVWYAEFPELAGCLAHGTTKEEALANAVEAKDAWLEVTFETDRNIPEPRPEIEYSGRFLLRVPKSLHQKLATEAGREGTSINRLAIQILSEELERRQTMRTVTDLVQTNFSNALRESARTSLASLGFSGLRSRELVNRFWGTHVVHVEPQKVGTIGIVVDDPIALQGFSNTSLLSDPERSSSTLPLSTLYRQMLTRFEKSEEEKA